MDFNPRHAGLTGHDRKCHALKRPEIDVHVERFRLECGKAIGYRCKLFADRFQMVQQEKPRRLSALQAWMPVPRSRVHGLTRLMSRHIFCSSNRNKFAKGVFLGYSVNWLTEDWYRATNASGGVSLMILKALVLALPATLFAGSVTLNDFVDTATMTATTITLGSGGTISANGSLLALILTGTFTPAGPISYSGIAPNFLLTGGSGTFTLTDSVFTPGGNEFLIGTYNLTSAIETGGSLNNMTLFGTMTVPAGGLTLGVNSDDVTAFLALLSLAGITSPIPVGGETENLAINVVNCTNGTPSACLPGGVAPASLTTDSTIQAATTTGTVQNVVVTSTVPEPGTVALFAGGLVGLAFLRRRRTRA